MRATLLAVSLLLLAACAVREQVDFVDGVAPGAVLQPILVATTRAPDPTQPGIPGWGRSRTVTYGRYVVSIPPDRRPGEITRPVGRQLANPEKDFMVESVQPLSEDGFEADLRVALRQEDSRRREAVIFVHGYNITFVEGLYRAAQLDHDLRLPGVMLHYSWPSLGEPLAYVHDRDSVLFARDGLITMIHAARAAGVERIILMAHSMGSQLVMESLRTMGQTRDPALRAIGGVFLISPDIDVDVFHEEAAGVGRLPQPFVIVTSQRDRVLQLSARLSGERARLGNIPNAQPVADLAVTVVDVAAFSQGLGHFVVGNSPTLINLFDQMGAVHAAFAGDAAGTLPLGAATVLTLQNATEIILRPLTGETRPRRRILPGSSTPSSAPQAG